MYTRQDPVNIQIVYQGKRLENSKEDFDLKLKPKRSRGAEAGQQPSTSMSSVARDEEMLMIKDNADEEWYEEEDANTSATLATQLHTVVYKTIMSEFQSSVYDSTESKDLQLLCP